MDRYALSQVSSVALLRDVHRHLADERQSVALVLAYLAEIDERKLFLPAAYDSMHAWCMGELHLSEDAASDRIRTARVALQFPAIFAMVADGRLHLAAVRLLAPYLTPESADELLAAAAHKSKAGIVDLLAARFPRPDVLALVQEPAAAAESIAASGGGPSVLSVPERIEGESGPVSGEHAPGHVGQRALVRPLSADSVAVQFTMARATHEKLKRVRELLGHELPAADIAHVFDRALDALLTRLEEAQVRGHHAAPATCAAHQGQPSLHPGPRDAGRLGA